MVCNNKILDNTTSDMVYHEVIIKIRKHFFHHFYVSGLFRQDIRFLSGKLSAWFASHQWIHSSSTFNIHDGF